MREPMLAEAIRRYASIADIGLRMELAREIARTRAPELTLAYRNVVTVASGFKRRTRGGSERLFREPCVIFMVRRKIAKSAIGAQHPQFLPRHLLTYADWKGERILVAVPTDVQAEDEFALGQAQSLGAIFHESLAEYGALCALVDVKAGGSVRRFGLSALHVLTPGFGTGLTQPAKNAGIERSDGDPQPASAPRIGVTSAAGGELAPWPAISFDAQLMTLTNPNEATRMLRSMPLSSLEPYVDGPGRLAQLAGAGLGFDFLVHDNHPDVMGARQRVRGRFRGFAPPAFSSEYRTRQGGILKVHHHELLLVQFTTGATTMGGDSGSPVVIWLSKTECTLAGMHVAARGGIAHVIPAWSLMRAANYFSNADDGVTMEPVAIA